MLAGTGGNTNRRLSKGTWGKGGPTGSNSIKCKVFLLTHVEKERMERQTSILSTEPGSNDWESSALNTKPVLGTEVCLPILPYVLPAVLDYSVNFPLTDLNFMLSEPLQGSTRHTSPSREEPRWGKYWPLYVDIYGISTWWWISKVLYLRVAGHYEY